MNRLAINLFGRFSATVDNTDIEGLKAKKLQEVLSYLLLHRDRHHNRERLASFFWDAESGTQSKKYLRQALWKLRQSLNTHQDNQTEILQVDSEWVFINPTARFSLDIMDFEDAYLSVQNIPGNRLNSNEASKLDTALALYRGELLEGWYHDWCSLDRGRYQQIYLFMLDKLITYCEENNAYQNGIEYGNLGLRVDPTQERIHRQLMRLYYLSKNRVTALRQYQRCREILKDELDVEPSHTTQKLFEQIKGDSLPETERPIDMTRHRNTELVLKALLHQLRQLQTQVNNNQD